MPELGRRDDGRRSFPKVYCPLCDGRAVDARDRIVHRAIRLLDAKDPMADFFIICPKCHHAIGVSLAVWHDNEKEPSPRR